MSECKKVGEMEKYIDNNGMPETRVAEMTSFKTLSFSANPRKLKKGFTLIEVLISMAILAVGLLGLAAIQAQGLKNNLSAYQRSQATQLTYNMADRMRLNMADAVEASGVYATDANTTAKIQVSPARASCSTTSGCSVAHMAENDLYEWNAKVSQVLPSGVGIITFADPAYTITVSWDDDRDTSTPVSGLSMSFIL